MSKSSVVVPENPSTIALSAEMAERIQELRREVWKLQDPVYKLKALQSRTVEYATQAYAKEPQALRKILTTIERIYGEDDEASLLLNIPNRIASLLSAKPCVFTMLPGLGTHESLSQYDVVLVGRYNTIASRHLVDLSTHLTRASSSKIAAPIFVANMRSSISEELADVMIERGLIPIFHRFRRALDARDCDTEHPTVQSQVEADSEKLQWAKKYGARGYFSCGTRRESIDFAKKLISHGAGGICVDVAIGNAEMTAATVLELKDFIKSGGYATQIVAGNVDTDEGYLLLAKAGADCIKVGVGPGSACTTRTTTGAGNGQASALMEVSVARFVLGNEAPHFMADGGIEGSKDVLVALALGACSVMIGKIAARCEESGALKKIIDGKKMCWYFGEASKWARLYENGGVKPGMAVEGRGGWIACSGSFDAALTEILGGLRNSFPYYNAASIADLQRKFSPSNQLCDLISGGTTGIRKSSHGTGAESGTRLQ